MKGKGNRILASALALAAAGLAFPDGASADTPLGTGITHYYNFDPELATTSTKEPPNAMFNITGQTWNAETKRLEINPAITLRLHGKGVGKTAPLKKPTNTFGKALSGGGDKMAAFFHDDGRHLCPTGDSWTISFWALRNELDKTSNDVLKPLLLANGIPLALNDVTAENLARACDTNVGLGFYVIPKGDDRYKVGVRLSETTDGENFEIRSIVSSRPFIWNTQQPKPVRDRSQERWHNVMLVRGAAGLTLYVDGKSQGRAEMEEGSSIEVVPGKKTLFTAKKGSAGQGNENALDDLAIWGRELGANEVTAVSAGTNPVSELADSIQTGITHYYDFETNMTAKINNTLFNITGRVWNAASSRLEVNPGITLVSKSKAPGGIGAPKVPKTGFGNAYSGGGTSARFYESDGSALCPGNGRWTISFWAMRKEAKDQPRLLVNGVPMTNYTAQTLSAPCTTNEGFGFYVLQSGKIGVRLSEKKTDGTYTIRSIASRDTFPWTEPVDPPTPTEAYWHNVMLVRDNTRLTLYVSGEEQGRTEMLPGSYIVVPTNGLYSTYPLNNSYVYMRQYNALDDLAIWNRALNPGEREAVMLGVVPVSLMARTPIRSMILIR